MESTISKILRELVAGKITIDEAEQAIENSFSQMFESNGLRDHFAGQAMQALVAMDLDAGGYRLVTDTAYKLADAMLEARK